jgi:hypothetical protein
MSPEETSFNMQVCSWGIVAENKETEKERKKNKK